jgi:hypothetical protein
MPIDPESFVFDSAPEGDPITESGETKPRRGRPPGTKTGEGRGRRSPGESKTISEAMGTMQSAYDMVALLLSPIAPNAARLFRDGISRAQESNRRAFEASPKLAKRVASTGEKGGGAAFFIGNAVLIAPVVAAASREISSKMPAKPATPKPQKRPQQPQQPQQRPTQGQDIPRQTARQVIPTGEGFQIPDVPVWDPNQQRVI